MFQTHDWCSSKNWSGAPDPHISPVLVLAALENGLRPPKPPQIYNGVFVAAANKTSSTTPMK
jgi:hypothetical protein